MKIAVPVTKRLYGVITVDVPEGSPILDEAATLLKKRREANKLATEKYQKNGESCIEWSDTKETADCSIDSWFAVREEGD